MFNNIGSKLKMLAKVICVAGIIYALATGIEQIVNEATRSGIKTIFLGALYSWIGSFGMYGLGQLIENTDILVARGNEAAQNRGRKAGQESVPVAEPWSEKPQPVAPQQGDEPESDEFVDMYCGSCGELLSFYRRDLQQEYQTCPMCGKRINVKQYRVTRYR